MGFKVKAGRTYLTYLNRLGARAAPGFAHDRDFQGKTRRVKRRRY